MKNLEIDLLNGINCIYLLTSTPDNHTGEYITCNYTTYTNVHDDMYDGY